MTEDVEVSRTIGRVASAIRMTDREDAAVTEAESWAEVPLSVMNRAAEVIRCRGNDLPKRMVDIMRARRKNG